MPDPVPALPDTERISSHTISGVGPYNVGFDVYGDSTDYAQWIKVFDDGVELTAVTDWTLDSPSGSLSTLSRPIDDARVTLVSSGRSGTLKIVGARRPRRTTQQTEGVGVSARTFNQAITDIVATMREFWDQFRRVPRVPPGETLALLEPLATRAGKYAKFDSVTGDLIAGGDEDDVEGGAVAAAASAAEAAASALAAATAETNAETAETNAETAETNAEAAAAIAEAAVSAVAFEYVWSTSTSGDPGSGKIAVNNASPGTATGIQISETDANGNGIAAEIARWAAPTNADGKARIKIAKNATNFLLLTLQSNWTDNGGWDNATVDGAALTGSLANNDPVYVMGVPSGNDGAGGGDLVAANNLSDLASPKTGFDNISIKGGDVASSGTIDLDAATGSLVDVTGTTTITAITLAEGRERIVRFTGALTLTNGASLVLPGGQSIATAAGDYAIFRGYAAGVVRCVDYIRKDGHPLTVLLATIASATTTDLGGNIAEQISISGTTTITGFGSTAPTGAVKFLRFEGALTLTHNGTSLIIPGAANIVTAAGDCAIVRHEGSGNWRVLTFLRAAGRPLNSAVSDTLTKGFAATSYNAGTQSSGTYTPDPANGNMQYAVNGGAHTLAPPSSDCHITVQYTNNGSAGAITTSGFTDVSGDSFTTTNGHDFMCYITKLNGFSQLHVVALQ